MCIFAYNVCVDQILFAAYSRTYNCTKGVWFASLQQKTSSFFFDSALAVRQVNFFKMGGHLDSLVKVGVIIAFKRTMAASLLVFDKFLIVFSSKKNLETSWSTLKSVFGSFRRDYLGAFKLVWYVLALLLLFITLI